MLIPWVSRQDVAIVDGCFDGEQARFDPRVTQCRYSGVARGISQPLSERRNRTSASSGSNPSK